MNAETIEKKAATRPQVADLTAKLFGKKLRGLRDEKYISIRDLRKTTGWAHKTIIDWEHGVRFPPIDALMILANCYEVPFLDVLGLLYESHEEARLQARLAKVS